VSVTPICLLMALRVRQGSSQQAQSASMANEVNRGVGACQAGGRPQRAKRSARAPRPGDEIHPGTPTYAAGAIPAGFDAENVDERYGPLCALNTTGIAAYTLIRSATGGVHASS
jgi:hypothetical protein